MEWIELNKNNKKIKIYGKKKETEKAKRLMEDLQLSGIENTDRLIIQRCIDDNKINAEILYEGNTVYPFNKTVKEFRKLQKEELLTSMSDYMYKFFMYACGEIAHYDKTGFRYYYDNSFRKLELNFLSQEHISSRFSDRDRIFKTLKIGKYFKERKLSDLDNLSLNKFKEIVERSRWNVTPKDKYWELKTDISDKHRFDFELDVSDGKISTIINSLSKYYDKFDVNEYAEEIVKFRGKATEPSVSTIVHISNIIKEKLSQLVSDLLYRSMVESAIIMDNSKGFELELER